MLYIFIYCSNVCKHGIYTIGCINTTGINTINWASGPYFIKITVDGVVLGISQVLSLPNALYPNNTANWNINYPEGVNGEIIKKRLDPSGYKVPEGKTYIFILPIHLQILIVFLLMDYVI